MVAADGPLASSDDPLADDGDDGPLSLVVVDAWPVEEQLETSSIVPMGTLFRCATFRRYLAPVSVDSIVASEPALLTTLYMVVSKAVESLFMIICLFANTKSPTRISFSCARRLASPYTLPFSFFSMSRSRSSSSTSIGCAIVGNLSRMSRPNMISAGDRSVVECLVVHQQIFI